MCSLYSPDSGCKRTDKSAGRFPRFNSFLAIRRSTSTGLSSRPTWLHGLTFKVVRDVSGGLHFPPNMCKPSWMDSQHPLTSRDVSEDGSPRLNKAAVNLLSSCRPEGCGSRICRSNAGSATPIRTLQQVEQSYCGLCSGNKKMVRVERSRGVQQISY